MSSSTSKKLNKSSLVCPVKVVDRIVKSSRELICLLGEFDLFYDESKDCCEISILNSVKSKLQAALFQVNLILDGSLINMEEYLKTKKREHDLDLITTVNEIANYKTQDFDGSFVPSLSVLKSNSCRTPTTYSSESVTPRCKVLFDMTADQAESKHIPPIINAVDLTSDYLSEDEVLFVRKPVNTSNVKKIPDELLYTTMVTPLRSARKAAKETPMSPAELRKFVSLSPDEIKENRRRRADSYERILRSQQSLKSSQKPHLLRNVGNHNRDEN